MDHCFLAYKNSKVHALRFGKGPKLLIALHGFADTAMLFSVLGKSLESRYTIYSLDLPFHGQTTWAKNHYDRSDISAIFSILLAKENQERFDLMGFSLGGRIAQKMLFDWQDQVDQLYLIAPYGLGFNASWVPQRLKTMLFLLAQKPERIIKLAGLLKRWNVLKPFHYKFTQHHLKNKENRERLFFTWQSLDHFKIEIKKVKALFKTSNISVSLYFGAKDRVIPLSQGEALSAGLDHVTLHVLDAGHRLVNEDLAVLLER